MTKPLVAERKGHPQNIRISDALEEDKARLKSQKGVISKQATLVTAGLSDGELQKAIGETMRPNDEQLNRINQFTRRAVTGDEVVTFNTLSCNDIVDRDDDQFSTQCVKDFAELPQPFSPVGKSYMVDHDYSVGNAIGRIYGVGTTKTSEGLFLTNEIYLPNTDQFAPIIEKIDFGIAWAVSVGVMLGKSACTVCGEGFSSWGFWCRNGHDKGLHYDPNSEETDDYGWPLPCDPNDPNAVKCVREFSEPRDFYELSQVFLGAQYYAALEDKAPEMAGLVKSVKANEFVGASAEEARKLPLRHEPEKVSEARTKFEVKEVEDGSLVWTDEDSLVWTFDPEDPEAGVLCLGKSNTTTKSEEDEDGSDASGSGTDDAIDPDDSGDDDSDDDGEPSGDEPEDESSTDGSGERSGSGSSESVDDEEDEDDDEEEKALSKTDVLAAAKTAKVPEELVKAVESSEGSGLDALLLAVTEENKSLRNEVGALTDKAALGDAYLKELRAEAIDWYVKSHLTGDTQAVKTETFERMLDRFGDDVELFRSVIEENKALAQEKFPKSVRRSSFTPDIHEKEALEERPSAAENDSAVRKIHG